MKLLSELSLPSVSAAPVYLSASESITAATERPHLQKRAPSDHSTWTV